MQVIGLELDPLTRLPLVSLSDGETTVAVRVALAEASVISAALGGIELERPCTHQLLCRTIERIGYRLVRAEIIDVQDDVHYARIVLASPDGAEVFEEARCSDAIATALFAGADVWVARWVVDSSLVSERTPIH